MPCYTAFHRRLLLLLLCPSIALAAKIDANVAPEPSGIELKVVERGPHHRVVEWFTQTTNELGNTQTFTNHYTEIGSGLHYLDENNSWKETVAEFLPVKGGFVAARGPHQVALAEDISTADRKSVV